MKRLAEEMANMKRPRQGDGDTAFMRHFINDNFPDVVNVLRRVDREYTRPKRRRGFNLLKRESKKSGFLYYARFSHNGRTLPTKFNTHTNDLAAAELFAANNRDRLVRQYLARKDGLMFTLLERFYTDEKELYISERSRREYNSMINRKFIPFLKREKIAALDQINEITLKRYRNDLRASGMKAQTVNNNMKPVKKIFAVLSGKGAIMNNPGDLVKGLEVHDSDRKKRGCYELERIRGVFNKRWKDDESFLLCLLIYTTGMRNSEIKQVCLKDVQEMDRCRFINVKKSKTVSGIRLVPLHGFVYKKLKAWAAKNKKDENSPLFNYGNASPFNDANNQLAKILKVSDEELEKENITFYSGRHYWKTLMRAEGLGEDIEEIFMGHKVVGNVKKLYEHKDKWGRTRLIEKTRQVFSILDKCIFTKP